MKKDHKVLLSAILAACTLFTAAPVDSFAGSDESVNVLTKKVERVASQAAEKGIYDTFCYGFYDLNADGTKEVFVNHGENAVTYQIFRYVPDTGKIKTVKIQNGSSIKSSLTNVNFVKKSGKNKLTVISGAVNGKDIITEYKFKDDILKAVATYTHKDGSKVYKKDGKKITAAAFNKKLKAANKLKNINCNRYDYTALYAYNKKIYFTPALAGAQVENVFAKDSIENYTDYAVSLWKYDPATSEYVDEKLNTYINGQTPSDTVIGKFDLSDMQLLPSEKYYYGTFEYAEDFVAKTTIDASEADRILPGFTLPDDGKEYVIHGKYILPEGAYLLSAEFTYSEAGSKQEIPFAKYKFVRTAVLG